jgi:hypothetical protein
LNSAERNPTRQVGKTAEDGKKYWSAWELATALRYSTREKFNCVLNKALQEAQNRGMQMGDYFNQTVEKVDYRVN